MRMKDVSLIIAHILLNISKKEEQKVLSQWTEKSKNNLEFVKGMQAFWNMDVEEEPKNFDFSRERLLARINTQQIKHRQKTISFYITRIAAIFILVATISGISIYLSSRFGMYQQSISVQISTDRGERSKITLPDGTLVWLNAETILKYKQENDLRKVELTGEAYFEVTHSEDHPFIVNSGETEIKVLGTKFNVSHYKESRVTEAALISGKINMTVNDLGKRIELNPGEKAVYNSDQKMIFKSESNVQNDISWQKAILYFENDPFNNMVHELERYYGVKFIYEPTGFDKIHYTGSIDNLEINKVLEFINLTIPIKYEINNKTILLRLK